MITKLSVSNFKCFNEIQEFDFSNLNLLTGLNGRGKSTVFQILLLLAQSYIKNGNIEKLYINGSFVNLGLFEDILNFASDNKIVQFHIETDGDIKNLVIGYKEDQERTGMISTMKIDNEDYFQSTGSLSSEEKSKERYLSPYPTDTVNKIFKNFYFISADRLGPTLYEDKEDEYESNPIGNLGQHRLNLLVSRKKANDIQFDNGKGVLIDEVNKWLDYIMDGASIDIKGKEKHRSVLQLFLNNNSKYHKTVKAINFGFGYSYILSIIITSLLAQPGSTVFIENPEAHLHPRAQSRLTKLLCKLARNNVQVFIETHSEHVLNSTRLSILGDNPILTKDDISMYFFGDDFKISKLVMDKDAQIENWPKGFFDQQENDLSEILQKGLLK